MLVFPSLPCYIQQIRIHTYRHGLSSPLDLDQPSLLARLAPFASRMVGSQGQEANCSHQVCVCVIIRQCLRLTRLCDSVNKTQECGASRYRTSNFVLTIIISISPSESIAQLQMLLFIWSNIDLEQVSTLASIPRLPIPEITANFVGKQQLKVVKYNKIYYKILPLYITRLSLQQSIKLTPFHGYL